MKTAIINGKVVTETSVIQATLLLENGKIQAILSPESPLDPSCQVIDAAGQYVVPGGIDGHVHFGGFGDIPIADDFYTGSKAALAGGTTTVVDFCEPAEGENPLACIARRKDAGKDAAVDYALHFTFTEGYRHELPLLPQIMEEGITNFKAYTYYPYTSLLPGDFLTIMETIHDKGSLLVHAEEKSIIDCMKERFPPESSDMTALSLTRPNIAEQLAVENVLAIAKLTGTRLCIAHTSSKETVAILERERAAGNHSFYLESCPHYMHFTRKNMEGPMGALYTMNPPLRSQQDADALLAAMIQEEISILSTDHCPYSKNYKLGTNYETVPCGVDGVQTRMQYCFSEAVIKGGLPMPAFARMTATNAAKFYGLYPQKGVIAVESDADLAFFDPEPSWTYSMKAVAGATDYSIFDGVPLRGKCTLTIKSGQVVMKDGVITAEKGSGKFLYTK